MAMPAASGSQRLAPVRGARTTAGPAAGADLAALLMAMRSMRSGCVQSEKPWPGSRSLGCEAGAGGWTLAGAANAAGVVQRVKLWLAGITSVVMGGIGAGGATGGGTTGQLAASSQRVNAAAGSWSSGGSAGGASAGQEFSSSQSVKHSPGR